MLQAGQRRQIFNHPRTGARQRYPRVLIGLGKVQFRVRISVDGANRRQLVQQSSLELPGFDFILFASELVDHRYPNLRIPNSLAAGRNVNKTPRICCYCRSCGIVVFCESSYLE
jgi:hypothetical protein